MAEFIAIIISLTALIVLFVMASDIGTIKKASIAQHNTLKQIYNLLEAERLKKEPPQNQNSTDDSKSINQRLKI